MWDIKDKICLITGATSGIGKATALALAKKNAHIIITYRNETIANELKDLIFAITGRKIKMYYCDFSSFVSIRKCAEQILSQHEQINVLINNAGIWESKRKLSEDKIELNFAVNYLAPFLFTNLLLDIIKKSAPARIINVSSGAHRKAEIHFKDLEFSRDFSGYKAYGQSKLANILFTKMLSEKLSGIGVTVNCVHPGVVSTGIFKNMNRIAIAILKPFLFSPEKGAETSVYLASSDDVSHISGKYFSKKKVVLSSAESNDMKKAEKLWEISSEYTGLKINNNMFTSDKKIKHYSNGEITIVWTPKLCTHVAYCFTELPEVFDISERPWINPLGATTKRIIQQVERCPTGALTYFYNEKQNNMEQENKKPEQQVQIKIIENGPAVIKGKCMLEDKNGQKTETEEVIAICRCGKSKNKPFCDGSHVVHPFE
ncbi:MAG: SDR family NAD(P)-dependent oxidoreductase [Bacteroidales bacterium]|jgi:NAD(P)-dependent dehydrogenase (short-subunit alcohol dehydrogenase family)/uncharacterized Fe-S cluster protein YjdI|nr:SDR family NAD(P)-dependent oxidoreductase [Bacteroidales bacterium]MDD4214043.1 SDR family NAD(P)-dependent oxidoreductase [Bacteroidales bacterium]